MRPMATFVYRGFPCITHSSKPSVGRFESHPGCTIRIENEEAMCLRLYRLGDGLFGNSVIRHQLIEPILSHLSMFDQLNASLVPHR